MIKEDASQDGDKASLRNVVFLEWPYNGEHEHNEHILIHWRNTNWNATVIAGGSSTLVVVVVVVVFVWW
jgi:hypothetical protein